MSPRGYGWHAGTANQERVVFKEGAKAACFREAVLRLSVRYRRIIMTCGSCKAAVGEHVIPYHAEAECTKGFT